MRNARPILLDLFLAGVAAYAAALLASEVSTSAAAVAVGVLHGGAIVLRRVAPIAMVAVLIATAVVQVLVLGVPAPFLGPAVLFAAYAVGSGLPRRTALPLLALQLLTLLVLLLAGPSFPGWSSVAQFAVMIVAAHVLGDGVRRWRELAEENGRRAAELERARRELARHAVVAERLRIARELHDVVAHSMSVISLHAGAGRLAVGTDPEVERRALEVIERTSRDALAEMHRLVAVLRDEDGDAVEAPAERGPAPGLDGLHALVAGVAEAGVAVELRTEGDLAAVPPGVALAAHRIVQEALTNVVGHAAPTRARVRVCAAPDAVDLLVEDDGPPAPWPAAPGGGHGTVGMRERVELYGGTLDVGPTGTGGWGVRARLPLGEPPP